MRAAISDNTHSIVVSAATAWEIGIKHQLGRLQFPVQKWSEMLTNMGFDPLLITPLHGLAAGALPRHHADPFDRMLVAQARLEGLTLVTIDQAVRQYDVPIFA